MSKDPLAATLASAPGRRVISKEGKVVQLFGHRPQVLEEIKRCRFEKHYSFGYIAELLNGGLPDGESISEAAVQKWLAKQKPSTGG